MKKPFLFADGGGVFFLPAAVILVCNFYDLYHTLYALQWVEGTTEWNPFCRALLHIPGLLPLYKLCAVPLWVAVLYQNRRSFPGRLGLWLCAAAFLINTLYQLQMAALFW